MATLPHDPIPLPPVHVYVSRDIAHDLGKMNKITAQVLGKLGCGGCHSGRLLLYHSLDSFVVNPKTLEPAEFGAFGAP